MTVLTEHAGRAWVFGDNISTDLLLPGRFTYGLMAGTLAGEEVAPSCMEALRPDWSSQVHTGDVLVTGHNFGCGSGRPAYIPLQALGIRLVLAESTSRLFFRNCINAGFTVINCPGILDIVNEGETVHVNVESGRVTVPSTGRSCAFPPMAPNSPPMKVLEAGGLMPYLQQWLKRDRQNER